VQKPDRARGLVLERGGIKSKKKLNGRNRKSETITIGEEKGSKKSKVGS